jgi:hypothetical protein
MTPLSAIPSGKGKRLTNLFNMFDRRSATSLWMIGDTFRIFVAVYPCMRTYSTPPAGRSSPIPMIPAGEPVFLSARQSPLFVIEFMVEGYFSRAPGTTE